MTLDDSCQRGTPREGNSDETMTTAPVYDTDCNNKSIVMDEGKCDNNGRVPIYLHNGEARGMVPNELSCEHGCRMRNMWGWPRHVISCSERER